jgi:hypothetical protein
VERQPGLQNVLWLGTAENGIRQFECDAKQAADAKAWLEKAMIDGMEAIMNGTIEVHVPVEVESRIARSWGEGG